SKTSDVNVRVSVTIAETIARTSTDVDFVIKIDVAYAVARVRADVDFVIVIDVQRAIARVRADVDLGVPAAILEAVARFGNRSREDEGCRGKNGKTEILHVEWKIVVLGKRMVFE